MALTKSDKEWVTNEIDGHLNPSRWKNVWEVLPLAAVVGILLALLSLAGAGWRYAFSRVEAEAQFQTHTTDNLTHTGERLTRIENTLGLLQAQVATTRYSNVPKQELKEHRDELANARIGLTGVPHDTPNFWPVSFQIISLLSQPQAAKVIEDVGKRPLSIFDNVSLPMVEREKNVLLKNSISGIRFYDSVIHFDRSVKLSNIAFINCVFIFPSQENPPVNLQQIGATLLAADLSKVTFNAS